MNDWKSNQDKTQHRRRRREKLRVGRNKPPGGSTPGTLVVPEGSPLPRVRALRYTAEAREEREIRAEAELAELCAKGGLLWVDVQGLGERGGDARPPRTEDEKGFVRAEEYSVDDRVQHHTEAAINTADKLRVEGREYVMRESDVCHFLVNR